MEMHGRARDILNGPDGDFEVIAEHSVRILASPLREIIEIEADPPRPELSALVGARAGGQSRALLAETLPGDKEAGTPLYLLIDDFAGASLVAGWAWSRWVDDWRKMARDKGTAKVAGNKGKMVGICSGFQPGSTALDSDDFPRHDIQSWSKVVSLANPDDPDGWHDMPAQQGVGFRRSRWLDIWAEGDGIGVDLGFQDSGTLPDEEMRAGIHEYRAKAIVDPQDWTLRSVAVDPRVLPYAECRGASPNAEIMKGARLTDMREAVLDSLKGTAGCTHLNDTLRSLAEVPQLARHLPQE